MILHSARNDSTHVPLKAAILIIRNNEIEEYSSKAYKILAREHQCHSEAKQLRQLLKNSHAENHVVSTIEEKTNNMVFMQL